MKRTLFSGICLIALALTAACGTNPDGAGPKVAVLDANSVMEQSKAGSEGLAYFENLTGDMRAQLEEMQQAMGQNATAEQQQKFQAEVGKARKQMQAEQERVMGVIRTKFTEAVELYRQEHGIDVVLLKNQVLANAPGADITQDVIAAMDAMDIQVLPEGQTAE